MDEKVIRGYAIASATVMKTRNGLDGQIEFKSIKIVRSRRDENGGAVFVDGKKQYDELWLDVEKDRSALHGITMDDLYRNPQKDSAQRFDIYYTERVSDRGNVFRTVTRMYKTREAKKAA